MSDESDISDLFETTLIIAVLKPSQLCYFPGHLVLKGPKITPGNSLARKTALRLL